MPAAFSVISAETSSSFIDAFISEDNDAIVLVNGNPPNGTIDPSMLWHLTTSTKQAIAALELEPVDTDM